MDCSAAAYATRSSTGEDGGLRSRCFRVEFRRRLSLAWIADFGLESNRT